MAVRATDTPGLRLSVTRSRTASSSNSRRPSRRCQPPVCFAGPISLSSRSECMCPRGPLASDLLPFIGRASLNDRIPSSSDDGYGIQPFQRALVPKATRHEESMDEEKSFPKHVASGTHAAIRAARGRVEYVAKREAVNFWTAALTSPKPRKRRTRR